MHEQPQSKAWEINSIIFTLERELERLDTLGAGIAAIHVDAAIEQLRSNLAVVNDNTPMPFDPSMLSLVESHPRANYRARD